MSDQWVEITMNRTLPARTGAAAPGQHLDLRALHVAQQEVDPR